jgi:replicative DNA helicase
MESVRTCAVHTGDSFFAASLFFIHSPTTFVANFIDDNRYAGDAVYSKVIKGKGSDRNSGGGANANVLQLAPSADRVPPHSHEAEMAVLGAIMLDRAAMNKVVEILPDAEGFYKEAHRQIFQAMLSMSERSITVDLVSLGEEMRRRGMLDVVGGSYYLAELNRSTPSAANIEHYARIVQEHSLKRQLIAAASTILETAFDPTSDALEEIDDAEKKIFDIAEKRLRKTYISMNKLAKDTFEQLARYASGNKEGLGVPTGYAKLDQLLGGLRKSDLVIIAARPSMGKTALALSIARNAAMESNVPVAFFSIEMDAMQLSMRLLSAEAGVNLSKLLHGTINDHDFSELARKMDKLAKTNIYIDDSASMTIMELRAKCRRLKAERGIGLIMIDYLQMLSVPKSESREREISTISRSLKQIAKELEVPVVALAQLNRSLESRSDKRPMLSDLRESGSIEQDADVVMFVNRPEYYQIATYDDGSPTENTAEIIVGKQRNGGVGTARVAYIKEFARFENLAFGMEAPPDYAGNISDFGGGNFGALAGGNAGGTRGADLSSYGSDAPF